MTVRGGNWPNNVLVEAREPAKLMADINEARP
jgi:hypothetical protein